MVQTTNTLLVLDARIVRETKALHLELGRPEKSPQNPLFSEEYFADPPKRWEVRYDNLYPNVTFDEKEGLFKLWYNVFIRAGASEQTPLAERGRDPYWGGDEVRDGLLYAVSTDGLSWTKPELGLIEYDGSSANNIVMTTESHGAHGTGVLVDPADPDPARRYKALFRHSRARKMAVAFSDDGIHWSEPVLWPEHNAVGDTHNFAIWSPDRERYVGITRDWVGPADERVRAVFRTESPDFVNWSEPVNVFQGKDAHDQIYSMPVFRVGGTYLGLPALFHKGDADAADWDAVDTELAWSPDTVTWNRLRPGEPLIHRGAGSYPDGAYDCGCIYAAAPVLIGDTHHIYYGGSNGLHNNWREGTFNLATLPRDRFAGYSAVGGNRGRLTTEALVLGEGDVVVNVEIADGGSLRVGVMDESGRFIDGYGLKDCDPIREGGLDIPVAWEKPAEALADRTANLVFELHEATLFSISGTVQLA